ncbi:hypothetical protein CIB95_07425 [Lottiidibacillus patelloidae]|uniref:DUF1405 domain-containing protein n=1 Tax=Lottiidibacillus patelloidae TaxID=2670334 RepID=A0A263BVU0_9BACI|nr:DUF1405 domain-containing protein [Lottiidibacillus patelloidae]OZM57286.1 hypothetical protein CIB95_07425 [Lottiidibacillus patelloidae]
MVSYFLKMLTNRWLLWLLLIINILGTIYGYYWYRFQLEDTPSHFYVFVPDSPTASLFFVFVLIAFLRGKNTPFFEALAIVTLFKYGIWAVGMNLGGWYVNGFIRPESIMLIFSHFAMAVQALLYAPYYRMRLWHLVFAAIWTLHNDVIDYVFFMVPRYSPLIEYTDIIGYITFWLSLISIYIAYRFGIKARRQVL